MDWRWICNNTNRPSLFLYLLKPTRARHLSETKVGNEIGFTMYNVHGSVPGCMAKCFACTSGHRELQNWNEIVFFTFALPFSYHHEFVGCIWYYVVLHSKFYWLILFLEHSFSYLLVSCLLPAVFGIFSCFFRVCCSCRFLGKWNNVVYVLYIQNDEHSSAFCYQQQNAYCHAFGR